MILFQKDHLISNSIQFQTRTLTLKTKLINGWYYHRVYFGLERVSEIY